MNYQASNPESLSETPERLSETKTRSGSPAAAAKKRAAVAEVLTSCRSANFLHKLEHLDCKTVRETVQFARVPRGRERFTHYQTLYQSLPELRSSERVKCGRTTLDVS